jgi:hypothetical protein
MKKPESKALQAAFDAIESCFSPEMSRLKDQTIQFGRTVEMAVNGFRPLTAPQYVTLLTDARTLLQQCEQTYAAEDGATGTSRGRQIALESNLKNLKYGFKQVEKKTGIYLPDLDDAAFAKSIEAHSAALVQSVPAHRPQHRRPD